jgi:phenylpropionate dioxygenase-like ring-hydroxylating dioxygenase large terminal subunit
MRLRAAGRRDDRAHASRYASRRMFIYFWYPAAASTELTDAPLARRMLGQDFVLFRDPAGVARCLANTCSHRGGSLAGGKVVGECIQCPYHGWQFDGTGTCRRIPSLGREARIPARTRIDAYPTVEKYGLVFAFLGDLDESRRPPLMEIPEYGREGWRATLQQYEFPFEYQRSIENGLDLAHNEFVHPTHGFSYENAETYRVETPQLIESEWGTGFWNDMLAPPLADRKMQEASGRTTRATVRIGTGHHGCASLWTFINPTPSMHIYQYMYEVPVESDRTRVYLVNLRNFLLEPENDRRMMERNEYVAFQDRDVLADLRPVLTPRSRNHEFLVPADRCVGRYRDLLQGWEDLGWRIDDEAVARHASSVAYAIPGPGRRETRRGGESAASGSGRRETRGWVLDPVPLVRPAATRADGSGFNR